MIKLRRIKRDGAEVLQYCEVIQQTPDVVSHTKWHDVPLEDAPEPEKPKEPREWWIDPLPSIPDEESGGANCLDAYDKKPSQGPSQWCDSLIHVVELPPGACVVTREKLAEAWDRSIGGYDAPYSAAQESKAFDMFSRALGLEDKER